VYVIPAGKIMTLTNGHLKLTPMEGDRGKRVAVDIFFRTLADTHGPHATAIVLSGADGDGAIGIKRIKERGGLTVVQDPEEAEHPSMPRSAIDKFIRIYSYDVDFQRKVQPGDSFEILYAGEDENPSDNSKVDVWFASLTTGGETKKFYRYQTTDDNLVDYYDESGKSAKKFLVRKPVAEGNMTSGFGGRNHPLLGYEKMHTGVDWASSTGTPVFAAGNGVIDKIGWEGGYGKYIRIRHANGYETAYGHMSAFARNMEAGKKVRQGQVIGYVGSTGLSTGAHLHYEILINGRFVDPMKIKLPRGRVLEGPLLAGFDQDRAKLEAMVTRATPSHYAQTR